MRLVHAITLSFLVGAAGGPAALGRPAPDAAGGEALRLGLDDAVAHTLARHPALGAADHARDGAAARAAQARSAWLPRAGVEAGYRYSGPVPELVVDTGITPPGESEPIVIRREAGTEHSAHVAAKVGWRAWDFGARDARIDAAEAGIAASGSEREARAADVAYAARSAYLAVLLFDETIAVTDRALTTARRALDESALRRRAGVGDDLEVASARSRVADLEARLVDARQSRVRALASLRSLLGAPPDAPLVLTDTLADRSAPPAPAPDTATAAEERRAGGDDEAHPTVARLRALSRAAERQRDAVARSFWPTVDLYGNLAYQYPHTFFDTDAAGLVWAAGVSLSWDLFDGGLRDRREDELAAREAEIDALAQAAREDIDRSAVDARSRVASARAALAAAERSREAATVYLEAARTALAAGTATSLDVRKAEEAVDRARLAAVKARFEGAVARAALLRAQGRTL